MHRQIKIKITELNDYLKCSLCKGYFIDATTITECLHSFCKSCIVRYIKKNDACPLCDLEIMYEKIGNFVKRDTNLQYLVYKLIPNIFKNEMKRRRNFFETNPRGIKHKLRGKLDKEALGESNDELFLMNEKKYDDISIEIEYVKDNSANEMVINEEDHRKYLLCPAKVPIRILKKLLATKFKLDNENMIEILYDDKSLNDDLVLIDIAYLFAWIPKNDPMKLKYRFIALPKQEVKLKQIENKINFKQESTKQTNLKPQIDIKQSLIVQQTKYEQNENNPLNQINSQNQNTQQIQSIYQAYGQYLNTEYFNYMRRLYQQHQQINTQNSYSQQQQQQINSQKTYANSDIADSLKETQMKILESAFLINQ